MKVIILSVPKFIANLYCIFLSILQIYTKADAVQITVNFGTLIIEYLVYMSSDQERGKVARMEQSPGLETTPPHQMMMMMMLSANVNFKLSRRPELSGSFPLPPPLRIR